MNNRVALLGCADDRAVGNNRGRIGAADGPSAFRKAWKKWNGRFPVKELLEDHGDAPLADQIGESHRNFASALTALHRFHDTSIVVGGGHDYAYAHLKGIRERFPPASLACLNIDPHFDLRKPNPLILSGSPFYMAIKEGVIKAQNLLEFGIGEHCNGSELWEFALKEEVGIVTMNSLEAVDKVKAFGTALRDLSSRVDYVVLSFDLDSVQEAYAPGVSAPAAFGFSPAEIFAMMRVAGRNEKVISLGIYELNPRFDIDNRTARLAALAAWHFLESRYFE